MSATPTASWPNQASSNVVAGGARDTTRATMTETTLPASSAGPTTAQPGITLAIVGVGLIGGSFAAALKQTGTVRCVLGVGRAPASLEKAQAMGLIDEVVDAEAAARRADLIVLAVPVGAMQAVLARMAPHLSAHAVLTDAGSTKVDVVAAARAALGARIGQFVPGHPIAGAETSGPDAAQAGLYRGKQVVLTPLPENAPEAIERVTRAWQACGARVRTMQAAQHDDVLGAVSHFPHLLAAAYMTQMMRSPEAALRLDMAGSGFRDFTRIAAGSPEMWRDIFLSNAQPLRAEVRALREMLDEWDSALARADGATLETLLDDAARARRDWQLSREA